MYVEKLSRNSFLDFYCTYSMLVNTGVITSSLRNFYPFPVYFKTSFYFSEWRHHHSGSQTSNLEFILDTLLSLTLAPTHPPPHQFITKSCHFTL